MAAIVAAVALAVLVVLALLPEPVEVDAAVVERGPLAVTIDEEGMTRVRARYAVSAPVTGQMARVPYEAGDFVSRGAVLTTIEPTPLTTREREQARAQVEAAAAAVDDAAAAAEQARDRLAQAERARARAERLQAGGALALQDLEEARLAAEEGRDELEAADARLERARAELEASRAALIGAEAGADGAAEALAIRVPAAGLVLRILEKSRRVVTAGTPIAEIGDVSSLEVVVDVLSSDAIEIAPGDPMRVSVTGEGPVIPAVVARVEPSGVEEVSALGVEELRVDVIGRLLVPPGPIGDQYRVEASIVVWQGSNVLKVPTSALFRLGEAWAAFVIEDGRARVRTVAVGRRGAEHAQVLSGLREGDVVVLYPGDDLEEGDRVAPRD